jgi:hypothetical protein
VLGGAPVGAFVLVVLVLESDSSHDCSGLLIFGHRQKFTEETDVAQRAQHAISRTTTSTRTTAAELTLLAPRSYLLAPFSIALIMSVAAHAAPYPLSTFTTVIPLEQLFSIVSRADKPAILRP